MIGNGQKWMGSDGVMALTSESFASSELSHLNSVMNGFIGLYVSFISIIYLFILLFC